MSGVRLTRRGRAFVNLLALAAFLLALGLAGHVETGI